MTTKKLGLAAGIVSLLFSITNTYSQSERQIVAKYKEALGNSVGIDSVHTMEVSGEFTIQNIALPITFWTKFPHYMRMEMQFQNLKFIQVSNDTVKWEHDPLNGKDSIEPVERDKDDRNSTFDFSSHDLLDYEKLHYRLKLIRKEKMDSLEVYRLELFKDKNSQPFSKFFINTKTSLLYKVEDDQGYRYFADYTRIRGFAFPRFVIDSKEKVQGRFSRINIDLELPDSLFVIPKDVLDQHHRDQQEGDDLLSKADAFYEAEQYDSADIYYTQVIEEDGESFSAYNSRGLTRIAKSEYYEAIADFNRAMKIRPAAWSAVNNRGLAKYYLGDFEGAVKDYGKSIELDSTIITPRKNRGRAYMQLRKYDLAVTDFSNAIKLNDKDGDAHYRLGIALAQLEKYSEALQSYQQAIRLNYVTGELHNYKGVTEYKLESYDSARVSFQKAMVAVPDNLQYLENYGRSFYALEKYEEAAEQFELYLKKDPNNADIHNMIGLCKYHDENYKGAIKDFSRSIELDGKVSVYYNNRASAKEFLQDYEGAIADYSESIRIYPNNAFVFYKRGLIKFHTSKKIEGCLDLATANEMKYEPAKEAIMKNCN